MNSNISLTHSETGVIQRKQEQQQPSETSTDDDGEYEYEGMKQLTKLYEEEASECEILAKKYEEEAKKYEHEAKKFAREVNDNEEKARECEKLAEKLVVNCKALAKNYEDRAKRYNDFKAEAIAKMELRVNSIEFSQLDMLSEQLAKQLDIYHAHKNASNRSKHLASKCGSRKKNDVNNNN